MPAFSIASKEKLAQCHPDLQRVFERVIAHFDCTILVGQRSEADQNAAFAAGRSKLKYPQSKHNKRPSMAVDVSPYPIEWGDRDRQHFFAGVVMGTAQSMGIKIRWGGDWDGDTETKDNTFDDLVHFEIG